MLVSHDFCRPKTNRHGIIRLHPDCVRWILEGKKKTTYSRNRRDGIYEVVDGPLLQPKHLGIFIEMTPHKNRPLREVQAGNFGTEGPFNNSEEFVLWYAQSGLCRIPARGWIHGVELVNVR